MPELHWKKREAVSRCRVDFPESHRGKATRKTWTGFAVIALPWRANITTMVKSELYKAKGEILGMNRSSYQRMPLEPTPI
jgi:hypothetical protein